MLDNIHQDAISRMDSAVGHTQNELNKIRTGRANPEIFDSIVIDYYGTPTPLKQVSTVSVPEPKLITLQAYEKSLIPLIEKAIVDANLGLTPGNNGNAILIPIPALSEERRKELIKLVHKIIEDGKIAVRNIRRDCLHKIHGFGKEENISEDEIKGRETDLQSITDKNIKDLDLHQENKEKELMKV
jgi:ribosome recycling factor